MVRQAISVLEYRRPLRLENHGPVPDSGTDQNCQFRLRRDTLS